MLSGQLLREVEQLCAGTERRPHKCATLTGNPNMRAVLLIGKLLPPVRYEQAGCRRDDATNSLLWLQFATDAVESTLLTKKNLEVS